MEREDLGCYLGNFLHRRFMKAIRKAYEMHEAAKEFGDYKPWDFHLLHEFVQNKDSEQIRQALDDLSVYNIFFLMFEKKRWRTCNLLLVVVRCQIVFCVLYVKRYFLYITKANFKFNREEGSCPPFF